MQPITQNKKRIKVQHIVGSGTAQIDVNRNISLPAVARKIVDVHAEIVELDYEIIPNKVIIKGALHKQIYYVEENDFVVKEHTITREEFTDFVHIPGAMPEMEAMLDGHILFADTNPASGDFPTDSFYQTAVLLVEVKVVELMTLDVVTDCHGDGISCRKELFSVECLVGAAEKQVTVAAEHELAEEARKVYDMAAVARDIDYEILPNKVLIRGTLQKQIYSVSEADDSVLNDSFENEFTVVVDIPGAKPDMEVYVRARVEFCEAKMVGTAPSQNVKANCILQVFVRVTELTRMHIVTEVSGAVADRCRIRIEDIIGKKCHQENVNQSIDVNANIPPGNVPFANIQVKLAKNTHACIRNVSYEKIRNKVIIKGVIHVQVYYVSCEANAVLRETSADIPFTTFVHFDGVNEDTLIRVKERIEYTDAKMDGESCNTSIVRAIAILEVCVCAYQIRDFMVVTDIKCPDRPPQVMTPPPQPKPIYEPPTPEPLPEPEPAAEECPPGGYEYIVQPGDTLAKIAAKFQDRVPGLAWQQIAALNNMYAPYTLNIGQVIKVPCVAGKG